MATQEQVDARIFQAALLQKAEAIQTAANAAQAAASSATASARAVAVDALSGLCWWRIYKGAFSDYGWTFKAFRHEQCPQRCEAEISKTVWAVGRPCEEQSISYCSCCTSRWWIWSVETVDIEYEAKHPSTWTSATFHGHCMAWVCDEQATTGAVTLTGGVLVQTLATRSRQPFCWGVWQMHSKRTWAWIWKRLQAIKKFEKKFYAGTGLIRNGQTLCNRMMMVVAQIAPQMLCQWRLTASRESMVNLGKARPAEGQVERQRQGQRQKQVFRWQRRQIWKRKDAEPGQG